MKNSKTLSLEESDVNKVYEFIQNIFKGVKTKVEIDVLAQKGSIKPDKSIMVRMYPHTGNKKGAHRQLTLHGLTTEQIYKYIDKHLD